MALGKMTVYSRARREVKNPSTTSTIYITSRDVMEACTNILDVPVVKTTIIVGWRSGGVRGVWGTSVIAALFIETVPIGVNKKIALRNKPPPLFLGARGGGRDRRVRTTENVRNTHTRGPFPPRPRVSPSAQSFEPMTYLLLTASGLCADRVPEAKVGCRRGWESRTAAAVPVADMITTSSWIVVDSE